MMRWRACALRAPGELELAPTEPIGNVEPVDNAVPIGGAGPADNVMRIGDSPQYASRPARFA